MFPESAGRSAAPGVSPAADTQARRESYIFISIFGVLNEKLFKNCLEWKILTKIDGYMENDNTCMFAGFKEKRRRKTKENWQTSEYDGIWVSNFKKQNILLTYFLKTLNKTVHHAKFKISTIRNNFFQGVI